MPRAVHFLEIRGIEELGRDAAFIQVSLRHRWRTMKTIGDLGIAIARERDLDGILELQAANQISNGGTLSAALSRSQLQSIMSEMPLLVARRDDDVVGFLIASTTEAVRDIPIIMAMVESYPSRARDAYVYGPICIDAKERGKGLAQRLFDELRRLLPGREGVLFIRRDNEASIRSHQKMGMREVSSFSYGGMDHVVFSYIG
jgi:predicted GNAT superfamily acetyltransferase